MCEIWWELNVESVTVWVSVNYEWVRRCWQDLLSPKIKDGSEAIINLTLLRALLEQKDWKTEEREFFFLLKVGDEKWGRKDWDHGHATLIFHITFYYMIFQPKNKQRSILSWKYIWIKTWIALESNGGNWISVTGGYDGWRRLFKFFWRIEKEENI